MIIYKDKLTGDELLSDAFKIQDNGVLWEVNCRKYPKGKDSFVLEGANPSAEGEDDAGGDDSGPAVMVHDIEENFQLNWLKPDEDGNDPKPSKDAFKAQIKSYIKKLNNKLKADGKSEDEIKAFQAGAAPAMKKIIANYDNYDIMMGSSMSAEGMYVLIDFREDGITPFATYWKDGLVEEKV
ncbi:uncharacterized protein GIQ15_03815 [Arthroderma uncinatum]|uniref:uncharacterized protein n=1 Tax=Arthroderma uncinatum TaxID=74035 RepID=UPI00144AC998|nr:uncharacterized protein GIQ15_03815 [Arthroderma uncinatum]KAF3481056.1 hypothetical protein GIQ15_03815 [Arthroderma uncinatum]